MKITTFTALAATIIFLAGQLSAAAEPRGFLIYTDPPSKYVEACEYILLDSGKPLYSAIVRADGQRIQLRTGGLWIAVGYPPQNPSADLVDLADGNVQKIQALIPRYPQFKEQLLTAQTKWQNALAVAKQNAINASTVQAQDPPPTIFSFTTSAGAAFKDVRVASVGIDEFAVMSEIGIEHVKFQDLDEDISTLPPAVKNQVQKFRKKIADRKVQEEQAALEKLTEETQQREEENRTKTRQRVTLEKNVEAENATDTNRQTMNFNKSKTMEAEASPNGRPGAGEDAIQNLDRFTANGKWGYKSAAGKIVIPAQFEYAGPVYNGFAKVWKDKCHGYITGKGVYFGPKLPDGLKQGDRPEWIGEELHSQLMVAVGEYGISKDELSRDLNRTREMLASEDHPDQLAMMAELQMLEQFTVNGNIWIENDSPKTEVPTRTAAGMTMGIPPLKLFIMKVVFDPWTLGATISILIASLIWKRFSRAASPPKK